MKDHSRTYHDFVFVYPVISRRSGGLSIGVNLNPDKRCNFDCVYCEVDRRTPGRADRVDLPQLEAELTAVIRSAKDGSLGADPKFAEAAELTRRVRDIAFSGDGEPTMIPNFDDCVALVARVKQAERLPETKIVLITDAAGLDKASVRRGLEIMDGNQGEIWGKLDAGTEDYYRQVNRSHVRFERILSNLLETARRRPIVIQTLFFKLHGVAMSAAELEAYCRRLNDLRASGGQILAVHAYTIARPTPEPWATRLEPEELEAKAAQIRSRTGLAVETYC
ncbi:MAG: radical SAM protein [Verrucomicrobiales bacterium]|nr:radical SAM protein [Verrucomicrobiales bacterium]MCP5526120.1 radical SAM protein [Verrucomicrobiales bacterium]